MKNLKLKIKKLIIKGFTLAELMIVLALFVVLFGSLLVMLTNSDRYWKQGQNKLVEQQEARRVIDNVVRLLRDSNPSWAINGTAYNFSISSNNSRMDFYKPSFNSTNEVTGLTKITFKLNPSNPNELWKKEGTSTEVTVSDKIESVYFGAGCANCSSYNCTSIDTSCPIVKLQVTTNQNANFTLESEVLLRNQNYTLENDTEVEQPGEGEF